MFIVLLVRDHVCVCLSGWVERKAQRTGSWILHSVGARFGSMTAKMLSPFASLLLESVGV